MKKSAFLSLLFLFVPFAAFGSVRVNEIAWMGTAISANNEWIELYNDDDVLVDLSGWTLFAEGVKKLSIPLSGTVAPKSFFLLERTNDDTVSGVPADQIYTGALGNGGETLVLKDKSGVEVQKIDASTGWLAGDNVTKETMQWIGSSWITAMATPRAKNTSLPDTNATEMKTSDTGKNASSSETASSSSHEDTPALSAHLSPLPLSAFSNQQKFFISAGRDRIAPVDGVLPFEAYALDASGKKAQGVSFVWSFGDGTTAKGAKVFHAYEYPGDYIVVLNAFSDENASAVARTNMRVFSPEVALSIHNEEDRAIISLFNHSPHEMNIGGWKLRYGQTTYVFPEDTLVGPKKEIIFSSLIISIAIKDGNAGELLSPNDKLFASALIATSTVLLPDSSREMVLGNMKNTLDRVAKEVLGVREKLAHQTTNSAPGQTDVFHQRASVIHVSPDAKNVSGGPSAGASSSEEKFQTITIKKREGFFQKLWDIFF